MNPTYLLITLLVICFATFSTWRAFASTYEGWVTVSAVACVATIFVVLFSFLADLGSVTVSVGAPARIEHTPYRVITTAFGEEQVWTDAFTVVNVDRITGIKRTVKHNAWGVELSKPFGPTYELVFKEAP